MGNAVVGDDAATAESGAPAVPNLTPFTKAFDSSAYVFPSSDLVAHLVLAHQTQMHNLITLTNYKTRLALYSQTGNSQETSVPGAPGATPGTPATATVVPASVRPQFEHPAEQLVRYLLFANETPLGGIDGARLIKSSSFAQEFSARGIRDPKGRSLRDFDLSARIFRYPCSYLIYSDAFDALPEPAKGYVYHRLLEILSGQDQSQDFAKVSGQDRRSVLEILLATKSGLPDEWKVYAKTNRIQVAGTAPSPVRGGLSSG